MKHLLSVLSTSLLLLISCTEPTITPTSLDADASSARKDAYTFTLKGDKPYTINLKGANFYFLEDHDFGTEPTIISRKLLVITDGMYAGSNNLLARSTYTNATWFVWLQFYSAKDTPLQPSEFLIAKNTDFRNNIPVVHFATEDYSHGFIIPATDLLSYPSYTSALGIPLLPSYIDKDEYMTVKGNIADGAVVTVTFTNAQAKIYSRSSIVGPLGNSTLNFTGTLLGI